jgi:hypothetical protein
MRSLVVAAGIICGFAPGAVREAVAQIGYLWSYDVTTLDTVNPVGHPELTHAASSGRGATHDVSARSDFEDR